MEKYYVTVDSEGTVCWYKDEACTICHRIGGPAIECANGDKKWGINGKLHRIGGPAIECANGDKQWYAAGKLHRIDGPAVEYANGDKQWWVNGKKWSKKKFTAMAALCIDKPITIDGVQYKLTPV